MKYYVLIFAAAMVLRGIAGYSTHHEFCEDAIRKLSADAVSETSFTNSLVTYIKGTNGLERLTARVVLAVAMYDIFEDATDDAALNLSATVCSNAISSSDCPDVTWQKAAASAILATAMASDRKYVQSFNVCTNAMARHMAEPQTTDDILLWSALCRHHMLPGLKVAESLSFYAALSSVFSGRGSSLLAYTNSLPTSAIMKIREAGYSDIKDIGDYLEPYVGCRPTADAEAK